MTDGKNISNDDIYKALMNLTAQTTEIREEIRCFKKELETRTNDIRRNYEKLEEENRKLKFKIRLTERRAKKNNIVIYGCPELPEEDILLTILKLVNEKLNVGLIVQDINNVYRIGAKDNNQVGAKDKKRPIKLELISYLKKSEIISKGHKLKGSNIYMKDDLTSEDLEERKHLMKHLAHAKQNNIPAKIRNYKLIVNGEAYSYQDLEHTPLDDDIDITNLTPPPTRNNHSAPATPTVSSEEFPLVNVFEDKEENTKNHFKITQPTNNTKGKTNGLSDSRKIKTSVGDNLRYSERLVKITNKKP